jgi:hypothetical protein
LLREHGLGLCRKAGDLEDLLLAACPRNRAEIRALIEALKCQVPVDLVASGRSIPWPLLSESLLRRLTNKSAMSEDAACWALESWAVVLDEIPPPYTAVELSCPECKSLFGAGDAGENDWLACPACSANVENPAMWERNLLPTQGAPPTIAAPVSLPAHRRAQRGMGRSLLNWLLAVLRRSEADEPGLGKLRARSEVLVDEPRRSGT